MRVLVVVASQTGRTARMAEEVVKGAEEAGAEAILATADDVEESEVLGCDALVLGSGVHMGGIESSMRRFFERTSPLWLHAQRGSRLRAPQGGPDLRGRDPRG